MTSLKTPPPRGHSLRCSGPGLPHVGSGGHRSAPDGCADTCWASPCLAEGLGWTPGSGGRAGQSEWGGPCGVPGPARRGRCRFSDCGQPEGGGARPVAAGVQRLEDHPLHRRARGAEAARSARPGGGPAAARAPRRQFEEDRGPRGGPRAGERPALEVGGPSRAVGGTPGSPPSRGSPAASAPWASAPHVGASEELGTRPGQSLPAAQACMDGRPGWPRTRPDSPGPVLWVRAQGRRWLVQGLSGSSESEEVSAAWGCAQVSFWAPPLPVPGASAAPRGSPSLCPGSL